ncbi:CPBP family intramembrane glutamic endopeptidase [Soonwooa sp.]|uniref:CPBP family intramembrane glutamic endopeptidase n=1 Tax=Soonwooa sp. TaxID=1938592 RepID=UPI0026372893|nr:CPBP family intramembrane glutamic endopeptidase [Soonwooa sp.]
MTPDFKSAILRVVPYIIVLIVLKIASRNKKINQDNFFLKKPVTPTRFFFWWLGFLLYVLATEFVLYKFNILEIKPWNHKPVTSIVLILGSVVLAPLLEELLFRGLLLQRLLNLKLKKYFAIIIQAIVFVLMHSFAYENTLTSNIGIVQTFIDGCLFGIARMTTKSIYTSVSMHATGNLIAVLERILIA